MRTPFRILLTTSVLMGGLLAAPVLYAQNTDNRAAPPNSSGTMGDGQGGGMMGNGMMGQEMMSQDMMKQMSRMMENCNKMMESAMAEHQHKDAPSPDEQMKPAR